MTSGICFTAAVLVSVLLAYALSGSILLALVPVAAALLLCVAWQGHQRRREQRQEAARRISAHFERRRRLALGQEPDPWMQFVRQHLTAAEITRMRAIARTGKFYAGRGQQS